MKKIKLLVMAMLLTIAGFSQITQSAVMVTSDIFFPKFVELENSGMKLCILDIEEYSLKIFNMDHSVYKTIPIDTVALGFVNNSVLLGWNFMGITENLFDLDNEIEFLFNFTLSPQDGSDDIVKTVIINEDGSILFEAENQLPIYAISPLKNADFGAKMYLFNKDYEANDSLFVYDLPGTVPCYSCDSQNKIYSPDNNKNSSLKSYPNPAKDYTIIEYEIPEGEKTAEIVIFNIEGKKVKSFKVDSNFKSLRISTNDLDAGTYFYNMKTKAGNSEGMKMVVVK